ncbi:tryptophanyl-tRNA synthetase [Desulfurobacterium thermolithotrophum DSM 11699]|uniref:Tryptophan--tRNA ligase n=1 Tax=Desulfurobacterium thermolithotrophum (strain DSM 11699 / BSA) TaxID=868864 RepID=F0S143_DESTD|nr:tryptophan--tRNA ligase [Desulfurobacterium thermolithotrophum]ADY73921.1 tryptophanyl-tRNA synthetase [Desulfurobacterium thermolithotrophum DSM 11699]
MEKEILVSNVDKEMKIALEKYEEPKDIKRVLSGMRPTGKIHLGNYLGALKTWLELQDKAECFFFIADWHAITTSYHDTKDLADNTLEMMADWVAAGLDPEKSVLFVQSSVKEHAELHLLLSMITPVRWLERNPTYKEMMENLKDRELATYGFLGYPVLQTADIVLYKADTVPVGIDQIPHLELSREIARRFNRFFGKLFPEPRPYLSEAPKLPGLDGRKMSKSYGNCIYLADTEEEVNKKVMSMVTDPSRVRKTDPGHPEICSVFAYHKIFTPLDKTKELEEACKKGEIGCVQCKKELAKNLNNFLVPIREKRQSLLSNPSKLIEVFSEGSKKAREVAKKTMEEVRNAINFLKV